MSESRVGGPSEARCLPLDLGPTPTVGLSRFPRVSPNKPEPKGSDVETGQKGTKERSPRKFGKTMRIPEK